MSVLKGANLLVMFLLELAVLGAAIWWGATVSAPLWMRILLSVAAPAVFIAVWALFGAANEPRFPQTGWRRVVLEVVWFGAASILLALAWTPLAGVVMFAVWFVNGVSPGVGSAEAVIAPIPACRAGIRGFSRAPVAPVARR